MKTKNLILLIAAILLSGNAISQIKSGESVTIDHPVNDDLYVAAGTVTVNAPVRGDLIVAGGTVIINDSVAQDVLVAGGNITLNGSVGDDIRCAGGTVRLFNKVLGDFIVAGGEVNIHDLSVVNGDLLSGGGKVTVDGTVKGKIRDASGEFVLNGSAEQDLECKGGKIVINGTVSGNSVLAANTIELGPDARFEKDVKYWNKEGSLDFGRSINGGKAIFDGSLEIEDGKWHYLGFASFVMVIWYLATALVMIVLIQYLFSLTLKNAANTVRNTSLKSLGLGFLFLVGVPLSIVLLFITVIGIPIAVLAAIAYGTVLLLATIIVALLVSNWINNTYYQSSWGNGRITIAAFGIFIFLKLASLTPVVGPLIMLLLACMAFGGILLNVKWRRNKALALA